MQTFPKVLKTDILKWNVRIFRYEDNSIIINQNRLTDYAEIISGKFFERFITLRERGYGDNAVHETIHARTILRAIHVKFAFIDEHIIKGHAVTLPEHFRFCSVDCEKRIICLEMKRLT